MASSSPSPVRVERRLTLMATSTSVTEQHKALRKVAKPPLQERLKDQEEKLSRLFKATRLISIRADSLKVG